jgi:DNA-binding IclR family transcriptional regulator
VKKHLLEVIIDWKTLAILKLFIANPNTQFYLLEIAKDANIPPATTMRIVQYLVKNDILQQINISKFKLYQLKQSKQLEFFKTLMESK